MILEQYQGESFRFYVTWEWPSTILAHGLLRFHTFAQQRLHAWYLEPSLFAKGAIGLTII